MFSQGVTRAAFLKRKLEDATLQQQANQGCGQDLRNFVVELFASASLSATDVVKLCHLITAAGGVGVSDLAVKPENASKHGHEHLVGVLSQTYPKPEVTSVTVPVLERRSITRSKDSLPVLLPSVIIRSQQNDPPRRSAEDLGSIFLEHPLKKKADARGVPACPIGIYCDGVEYTEHESFFCFCINNLFTEDSTLSVVVRPVLRCGSDCNE